MTEQQYKKSQIIKLDKGINLNIFDTIFTWRQVNGLKHDDYTRYRRFCTRRLKRLRQKVQLINKWEKNTKEKKMVFTKLKLIPEQIKTNECLMIPMLLIERCWAYANELQPVDETEAIKGHHQKRRIHKIRVFTRQIMTIIKVCNKRTQREINAYVSYMNGMADFEDGKFKEALDNYTKANELIGFISENLSEDGKIIYRDIIDDINAKLRVCKDEGAEEEDQSEALEKWRNIDGEAQLYTIPDDTMKETMKQYREGKKKTIEERKALIQKAVTHCNRMISNKKIENRMMYKELLDYAREEKYKLSVEEQIEGIKENEKHLGQFALVENHIDSNGKIENVLGQYSRLIMNEKKKANMSETTMECWNCYRKYYIALNLFNQMKYRESYTHLRKLLETIDELLSSVDANERERLEFTNACVHKLCVEILKNLWSEKSGDKPIMMDAAASYLEFPTIEVQQKKGGWLNWIWGGN